MQSQTLGTLGVPPPHVSGFVQVPQLTLVRVIPQLSVPVNVPHSALLSAQNSASDSGVQPQVLGTLGDPPPHVSGLVQVPQLTLVRVIPQLSVPVNVPHSALFRLQKVLVVSGVQPQVLGTLGDPPPHVSGLVHVPQLMLVRVTPQLSVPVKVPHSALFRLQKVGLVSGVQPQVLGTLGVPPPHVSGLVQVPQLTLVRVTPQLSVPVNVPHSALFRLQKVVVVSGVQPQVLGTLGVPPPHVSGLVQVPQLILVRVLPQLSVPVNVPHSALFRLQKVGFDSGVHAHTLGTLGIPPPHVSGLVQVPQFSVRVVPQLSVPVKLPQSLPLREQKVAGDSGVQTQTF